LEHYIGPMEHYTGSMEHYIGPMEHYTGPMEHYIGLMEHYTDPVEHYIGLMEHYSGPGMLTFANCSITNRSCSPPKNRRCISSTFALFSARVCLAIRPVSLLQDEPPVSTFLLHKGTTPCNVTYP